MKDLRYSILGSLYKVEMGGRDEIEILDENMGECRPFSKRILVMTDREDCTEEEVKVRTEEVIAHELFHAFVFEAGLDLEPHIEELLAVFYSRNHTKMETLISEIMKESGV